MDKFVRTTDKLLPVLIGFDYEHIMARAVIEERAAVRSPNTDHILKPAEVTITITAKGEGATRLAELVTAVEPIALSFAGVPIQPISKKENR